jgi:hypothetical protein
MSIARSTWVASATLAAACATGGGRGEQGDLAEARAADACGPRERSRGARTYSEAERRRILALREAGESLAAVARAVGGSRGDVRSAERSARAERSAGAEGRSPRSGERALARPSAPSRSANGEGLRGTGSEGQRGKGEAARAQGSGEAALASGKAGRGEATTEGTVGVSVPAPARLGGWAPCMSDGEALARAQSGDQGGDLGGDRGAPLGGDYGGGQGLAAGGPRR